MKLQTYSISFSTVVWRIYLMMTMVIIGLFFNQIWLALLAFPVYLSFMLGLKITFQKTHPSKMFKKKSIPTKAIKIAN